MIRFKKFGNQLFTFSASILFLVFIVATNGCMSNAPHRLKSESIDTNLINLISDSAQKKLIAQYSIENHPEFTLGFVEFDDQGDFWSRSQLNALEKVILKESERTDTDGLLMMVFVHGWKHNAAVCDENVVCFREVLQGLYNTERIRARHKGILPRRIVGVFVGWRGLSVTPVGLTELSFWGRKETAHKVGKGQVLELFTRLEVLRDRLNVDNNNTNLIIIGHSFGAAVTFSALSSLFLERQTRSDMRASYDDPDDIVDGFADMVVLVNPAFEASLYTGIHELARNRKSYSKNQPVVLTVIQSETDSATGLAFPVGQFFSTLFEDTSSKKQNDTLLTSLGNYEGYRTHSLVKISKNSFRGDGPGLIDDITEFNGNESRGDSDCMCSYLDAKVLSSIDIARNAEILKLRNESTNIDENRIYGNVELTRFNNDIHPFIPFVVIGATDEIITEHNGIYNKLFLNFLREYVGQMDERKSYLLKNKIKQSTH